MAAEHKNAEVTRLLLDEGASAGVKDDNGMSALSLLISQMPVVVSLNKDSESNNHNILKFPEIISCLNSINKKGKVISVKCYESFKVLSKISLKQISPP